jgi:flagellar basal-body rod protein FlgB
MSEINNDAAVIDMLRRQLSFAAAKQGVVAGNIANLNTPGYRAKEADFGGALDEALKSRTEMTRTDPGHLVPTRTDTPAVRDVDGLPARRDGNTVQVDRELLALGKATGEFSQAQTALAAKFRLIRYAITEGR